MWQLKSKIMLMKHMGVFMSKSTLSTYMVREELLKAPVIPQCRLLHLNMQVKLNLFFFSFRSAVKISKTWLWLYTFIQE